MPRVHCVIHGVVQGVGFRYFAQRAARNHGLCGWVRNVGGEFVECEAEGPSGALESFLEDLRRGPAFARVTNMDVERMKDEAGYTDFEIWPSR